MTINNTTSLELINNIKEYLVHTFNYIYPYIVVYSLFLIDNLILFYTIGGVIFVLIFIIFHFLKKEELNIFKMIFYYILLPVTLPFYLIWIINELIKKIIIFPLFRVEYPYISPKIKENIFEINELQKIKARKRREITYEHDNLVNIK